MIVAFCKPGLAATRAWRWHGACSTPAVDRIRPPRPGELVDYLVYVLWAGVLLVMLGWYV